MRRSPILLTAGLVLCGLLVGCQEPTGPLAEGIGAKKDYDRPLPPGAYALRKLTDPAEIPDFTAAFTDLGDLREAVRRSLNYLSKPSSRNFYPYTAGPGDVVAHADVVQSLQGFLQLLDSGRTPAEMNAAVRRRYDVYVSIGCDDEGTVLFTGYYTPIFDASPTRSARFRFPLYKQPADLVKGFDGRILGRRTAGGRIEPYPPRRQIEESNMLAGTELYWLADEFEAYIAHVQGSVRLRLPDGKIVTAGYAANNGHEYKSVAKEMVAEGKLAAERLSLRAMIDYFKAHPGEVRQYTWRNPRYVFFADTPDASPRGSLNEPVTRLRSVATDKSIFPRASLTFIATKLPERTGVGAIEARPYAGFALDQDTGGAIRAPGRCDVYMGVGEESGELAGRTYEEGRLYYLFMKREAALPATAPAP